MELFQVESTSNVVRLNQRNL